MNRGRKLKRMRRFINYFGVIDREYKLPPDKSYRPYRKGSYYAHFYSNLYDMSISVTDVDKYAVYKAIEKEIIIRVTEEYYDRMR